MRRILAVLRPVRRATVATPVTQAVRTAVVGEIDASGAQVFKAHWLSLTALTDFVAFIPCQICHLGNQYGHKQLLNQEWLFKARLPGYGAIACRLEPSCTRKGTVET